MELTRRRLAISITATAAIGAARHAHAQGLPSPAGRPILSISGKIAVFNADGAARFDRPMLEALGMTSFTTTTPWYDGPVRFEGIPMAVLMRTVQASGETAIATALNDYETKIPLSDFTDFNVLLALKRDGEYMPVKDKGPLFIVYPYDSDPTLKSQKYYSRSAWQLARLVIA